MNIDERDYLDFKDVLIKPKRSNLNSRSEVNLERTFECKHSGVKWTGIPIIAANMDTVGTFEMAKVLSKYKILTAIHKHYSVNEWKDFYNSCSEEEKKEIFSNVFITIGTSETDRNKMIEIINIIPEINKICIDIANGYSEHFLNAIKKVRERFPHFYILAGNVVSYEMTEELILNGASSVKVGIGPGCFVDTEKVLTLNGLIKIKDLKIGDEVLTHKNRYKKIVNKIEHYEKDKLISINGIKSTINHEYYVIDKINKNIVNKDNIEKFSKWIPAYKLNKEKHLIVNYSELKFEEIIEKEEISYSGYVYDLEVEEDHSFNIEGNIVHNSVCTTRKMTGIGVPQLSAIIECSDAAHGLDGQICGDGGCTVPGDVSKGFAGGADFIMLGGMLAGHDESGGNIFTKNINGEDKKFVEFYGMSSKSAMNKHNGGVSNYRASEGKRVEIEYKGKVEDTIKEILGGLRSTCTYVGASKLKHLTKRTTFIKVKQQINEIFGKS